MSLGLVYRHIIFLSTKTAATAYCGIFCVYLFVSSAITFAADVASTSALLDCVQYFAFGEELLPADSFLYVDGETSLDDWFYLFGDVLVFLEDISFVFCYVFVELGIAAAVER